METSEVICAVSTAPGIGAIAVLRMSGTGCIALTDRIFESPSGKKLTGSKANTVHFGKILEEGCLLDEVLVTIFHAPHSFTGEESVEIACHGSLYIQQRLLQLLVNQGARMATPGEFTQRAFLNGKMDLSQAEAVADLIASSSAASHRMALKQMKGGFSAELMKLRGELLHITSLLELEQEMYKHLKEAGKPVIFVSHNRDEVYRLCDTVSCMNRGKMEVMEPLKEFFQNPKTRTAAILSGCKNISAAERVDAHTLRAVDWGVTLHVKEREIADDIRAVGIRAHFLATVERPGEENVFPVNESEIWEDPFEWNISFRKNAECSWLQWNIAKTDWSPEMGIPKELYLKEEDILLLTDS